MSLLFLFFLSWHLIFLPPTLSLPPSATATFSRFLPASLIHLLIMQKVNSFLMWIILCQGAFTNYLQKVFYKQMLTAGDFSVSCIFSCSFSSVFFFPVSDITIRFEGQAKSSWEVSGGDSNKNYRAYETYIDDSITLYSSDGQGKILPK